MLLIRTAELPYESRESSLFRLDNDHIGRCVAAAGYYEHHNLQAVMRFLRGKKINPTIAVDVGANIGNHTLFLARRFECVYAFEPHPALFQILQGNCAWNGVKNVQCINSALSDTSGKMYLGQELSNNSGTFSLNHEKSPSDQEVVVERGDSILQGVKHPVALIKVDVEGFENEVLNGLQRIIKKHSPVVWFEARDSLSAEATINLLRKWGYCEFLAPVPSALRKGSIGRYLRAPCRRAYLKPLRELYDQHYSCILAAK